MLDRLKALVGFSTAEPIRLSALLRLPLIALIMALIAVSDIDPWFPFVFWAVMAAYVASATMWLAIVVRRPLARWAAPTATALDIVAVVALCIAAGTAAADLLPLLFLLPISLAFESRPLVTAALGIAAAVGYLVVWAVYYSRDQPDQHWDKTILHAVLLLWSAAMLTGLCFVLSQRSKRVASLLDLRRRLVAESMSADERKNRELAEELHDGPLQDVLAAGLTLDEIDEPRHHASEIAATADILRGTAERLRNVVTGLHPQVLHRLGLAAALRELMRLYDGRFRIHTEFHEVGKPAAQAILYRSARELLTNVHKHANAESAYVTLRRVADQIVLVVEDDGIGFSTARLDNAVVEGHIGLASLIARVDSMGGTVDIDTRPGAGTRVSVSMPDG